VYGRELEQGYAIAASNGGHRGTIVDPTFGLDPTLGQDYAHVALGTTVRVAKAVIAAYYGERPKYSYLSGCSNGGRNAFNAAAKYGHEYDGVIAAAPTLNLSGLIAGWMRMVPGTILTPDKIATIDAATLAACDRLDGLKDGIISRPDVCSIDAASIPGLTPAEIAVVNAIRSDTKLSDGTVVYSKNGYGPLIWAPVAGVLGIGHVQYIVYRDPSWDPSSYDIDTDYPKIAKIVEGVYDFSADTEPLVRYLKEGRKMIVWHGTDDTILSHYDTARTFEDLMEAAGGSGRTNAKLYLPVGVNHCTGGPGADTFDMIGAMAEWVENGREPKTLVASKLDSDGQALFTRPICEYPFFPYYNGKGDPTDAKSFKCKHSRP
jgi:feruloyl esterase